MANVSEKDKSKQGDIRKMAIKVLSSSKSDIRLIKKIESGQGLTSGELNDFLTVASDVCPIHKNNMDLVKWSLTTALWASNSPVKTEA